MQSYTGRLVDNPTERGFETGLRQRFEDPKGYLPDQGLVRAVNASLILGQPLLLTGDPGVGKSRLADSVAYCLGLGKVLSVFAKSDMRAADIFYSFDHMRRLFDYQADEKLPAARYLTFNALGRAILLAGGPDAMTEPLPSSGEGVSFRHEELLEENAFRPLKQRAADGSQQAVVLIDEIDKAPRDVPNDILNEIDKMLFDVPEIGQRIAAPPDRKPFVVMTSNSEKNLPDPFLRRCVFYRIPMPQREADKEIGDPSLEDIVEGRISNMRAGGILLEDALEIFSMLRSPENRLDYKPSLPELMNWLLFLTKVKGLKPSDSLRKGKGAAEALSNLHILLKNELGIQRGKQIIERWKDKRD